MTNGVRCMRCMSCRPSAPPAPSHTGRWRMPAMRLPSFGTSSASCSASCRSGPMHVHHALQTGCVQCHASAALLHCGAGPRAKPVLCLQGEVSNAAPALRQLWLPQRLRMSTGPVGSQQGCPCIMQYMQSTGSHNHVPSECRRGAHGSCIQNMAVHLSIKALVRLGAAGCWGGLGGRHLIPVERPERQLERIRAQHQAAGAVSSREGRGRHIVSQHR
jgi:hypothetical protein